MIRWLISKWRNRHDKGLENPKHKFGHTYRFAPAENAEQRQAQQQLAVSAAKARDQRERQRQRIAAGRRPRKADQQPTKLRGVK